MNRAYFKIALLFILSCATLHKDARDRLHQHILAGEYEKAIKHIENSQSFQREETRLLKLVEKGKVYLLKGNYPKSLNYFDQALELSRQLYTIRVSKKISSQLIGKSSDIYYGESYEVSMIRFYQVLNHYLLHMKGGYFETIDGKRQLQPITQQQKRFHLRASRNILLEWDSHLDNLKNMTQGEITYKDDLLAKVFGAFIHEQLGGRANEQTAKNLYQSAKEVLFKNFGILDDYNLKAKKFRDNFTQLPNLPIETVKQEYFAPTTFYNDLVEYIEARLKSLNQQRSDNTFILVEDGFITKKVAEEFKFPIPLVNLSYHGQEKRSFISFTLTILGLASHHEPAIFFELPIIPKVKTKFYHLIVKDKQGKIVEQKPLALLNPLAQLAHLTYEQHRSSNLKQIGTRIALKHLAALTTAYKLYKTQLQKSEFLALTIASSSYMLASKGIRESERADLRSWSTLPFSFRLTSLNLTPGNYKIYIKTDSQGRERLLGTTHIKKGQNFFHYHLK